MCPSGKPNWRIAPLFLALLSVSPLALAGVSETILTVTASSLRGEGSIAVSADQGYWDGDDFFWSIDHALEIRDADNHLLGTFGPATVSFYADPQVTLGFSVQASDQSTSFTITSAQLSFPTIAAGMARADAAFTLLDFGVSGATLTGDGPTGGAYLTQYNGFVPYGTTFAEAIGQIQVIPPESLQTAEYYSAPMGQYLPIGAVSSMSSQIAFTLSPLALASGSANFEIIPEPATLALLCLGLMVARRR